jgi:hypothetical protein
MRNAYKILVGKSEETRPFGRHRHRWEDNIEMFLKEIGLEVLDWIHLAQYKVWWLTLVNTGNEPSNSIKGGEFLDQLSDY